MFDYAKTNISFSGCDMVCTISMTLPDGSKTTKVIGSLQTLSLSLYQSKAPVRTIGNINAKDYVQGTRTIAGSLVFAVFNRHWAKEFLNETASAGGYGVSLIADELPPFDITISFTNEFGERAKMAIYGVRLVSEGLVLSCNDVYTENTYQFVALGTDYIDTVEGKKGGGVVTINKIDTGVAKEMSGFTQKIIKVDSSQPNNSVKITPMTKVTYKQKDTNLMEVKITQQ